MRKRNKSFTLIELLIVTTILAVTSLAIYAVFSSGIKIWQVVNRQIPEEDLGIFFDKFTSDLRNSFKFKGVSFTGRRDGIEFAVLLNSPRLQSNTVGEIIYSYDNRTKVLSRELLDFSHIFTGDNGRTQRLLRDVDDLKFQYYFYDAKTKEYEWRDEWPEDEETLPLAVQIELELDAGGKTDRFIKTVNIPVGG